jgi:hypothetical protein
MWMMIVGSPGLADLHEQARQWLVGHGHAEEANIVIERRKGNKLKRSHDVVSRRWKSKKPRERES